MSRCTHASASVPTSASALGSSRRRARSSPGSSRFAYAANDTKRCARFARASGPRAAVSSDDGRSHATGRHVLQSAAVQRATGTGTSARMFSPARRSCRPTLSHPRWWVWPRYQPRSVTANTGSPTRALSSTETGRSDSSSTLPSGPVSSTKRTTICVRPKTLRRRRRRSCWSRQKGTSPKSRSSKMTTRGHARRCCRGISETCWPRLQRSTRASTSRS